MFAKRFHFVCMHKQIYGATEKNERERGWPMALNVDQSSNQISQQSFTRWMHLPFPFIIMRLLLIIIIITTLLNYRFDFVQITRKRSACLRCVYLQWAHTQRRLFALLSICCVWLAVCVVRIQVGSQKRESSSSLFIILQSIMRESYRPSIELVDKQLKCDAERRPSLLI